MPIFLGVLLALGIRVALFRFRRRQATRWNISDGAVEAIDRPITFRKVWWQTNPPRPSWRARRDRCAGSLTIDSLQRRVELRGKNGAELILGNPSDVRMYLRREVVIPWIEVRFEGSSEPRTVFLNDCRWLGWHEQLTGGNVRIARRFAALLR